MDKLLKGTRWVFVGCGGTFYMASSYLAVLLRKFGHHRYPILFDPDTVDTENWDRQWPGMKPGTLKVSHAESMLHTDCLGISTVFNPNDPVLVKATANRPVLVVVNVDNDRARLDVREWLSERQSPGAMLVSGCEANLGQSYYGIWRDGEAVHDWLVDHPDVVSADQAGSNPCGLQTAESNLLTGMIVGMNLEDLVDDLVAPVPVSMVEWYWNQDENGILKVWCSLVQPTSLREEVPVGGGN